MGAHSWSASSELVAADVGIREKIVLSDSSPASLTHRSRRWSTMAEEESARLWQVNRTIHELVKDRVSIRKIRLRFDCDLNL